MFGQGFIMLLPLFLQATAVFSKYHAPAHIKDECPVGGVHVIGVRGTMEDPGFGALEPIVNDTLAKIPGSTSKAIIYPAAGVRKGPPPLNLTIFEFDEYKDSEEEGYQKLVTEIKDFQQQCPLSNIVLLGYSQGAQIVGDALCGSYGIVFPIKYAMQLRFLQNVKAIVQLGDPTNIPGLEWHRGNSTDEKSGIFPRNTLLACRRFGSSWLSYCDENDFFCDSGLQSKFAPHMIYVDKYKDEIVDFIVSKAKAQSPPPAPEYQLNLNVDLKI